MWSDRLSPTASACRSDRRRKVQERHEEDGPNRQSEDGKGHRHPPTSRNPRGRLVGPPRRVPGSDVVHPSILYRLPIYRQPDEFSCPNTMTTAPFERAEHGEGRVRSRSLRCLGPIAKEASWPSSRGGVLRPSARSAARRRTEWPRWWPDLACGFAMNASTSVTTSSPPIPIRLPRKTLGRLTPRYGQRGAPIPPIGARFQFGLSPPRSPGRRIRSRGRRQRRRRRLRGPYSH